MSEINLLETINTNLQELGFDVVSYKETTPNKSLLFTVKTEDPSFLDNVQDHKGVIFDGYSARGDLYDLVYVFPKED